MFGRAVMVTETVDIYGTVLSGDDSGAFFAKGASLAGDTYKMEFIIDPSYGNIAPPQTYYSSIYVDGLPVNGGYPISAEFTIVNSLGQTASVMIPSAPYSMASRDVAEATYKATGHVPGAPAGSSSALSETLYYPPGTLDDNWVVRPPVTPLSKSLGSFSVYDHDGSAYGRLSATSVSVHY